MRKLAHITEKAVVSQYAKFHGATRAAVGQEISTNRLRTTFRGQLSSDSSTGAIKMALWRKRQTLDLRFHLRFPVVITFHIIMCNYA